MVNEGYVQDVKPETSRFPSSIAEENQQPPTEDRPDIVSTHESVHEGLQGVEKSFQRPVITASQNTEAVGASLELSSQNAQQETSLQDLEESAASTPQKTAEYSASGYPTPTSMVGVNTYKLLGEVLTDTDHNTLRRSSSVPQLSSSPATGASSDTIYKTPRHSDTPSSSSLIKLRQAVHKRQMLSKKHHQTLAEHLKDEEKDNENTDWVALVEWMKITHQAEVSLLTKGHAVKVEEMRQERSEIRRRLEVRNRELRAMRREMRDLKRSIEESATAQKEIQQVPTSQAAGESDTESVDEDEGGVSLANYYAGNTKKARDVLENSCSTPQATGETDCGMRTDGQGKGNNQAKTLKMETVEENKRLQRALRLQLMEHSEAPVQVKAGPSAPIRASEGETSSPKVVAIGGHSRAPFTEIKDLQDHNRALKANLEFTREIIHNMRTEAELAEKQIKKLRAENHFAQLEVGHCNAANALYRAAGEDDNPARTAHLDSLLKRKDEAFTDLEERAAGYADALAEEQRRRAVDKVYHEGKIRGFRNELAHRINMNQALTEGKSILKAQNDEFLRMFENKIYQDDMIKAFLLYHSAVLKDNALLTNMINERKCYILATEKELSELKEQKIHDDHIAACALAHHRQTQQSLNGLMYVNHQLNAKVELQEEMREEARAEFEGQIQQRTDELRQTVQFGADDFLLERVQAQEAQIAFLSNEMTQLNRFAHYWRTRALEQQEDFCPIFNGAEVADFDAEDTRYRLHEAERQIQKLQRAIREGEGKGKGKEKEDVETGHDGSNWLIGRVEAAKEAEKFAWME